jgi:hypothetical protein
MSRLFVTTFAETIDPVSGDLVRVPDCDLSGASSWWAFDFGQTGDRVVIAANGIDVAPSGTFDIGDPTTTIGTILTGGQRNAFENRFGITLDADMTVGAALFLYHEAQGGNPISPGKSRSYRVTLAGWTLYEQPVIAGGAATWLTDSLGGRTDGTSVEADAAWGLAWGGVNVCEFTNGEGAGGEQVAAHAATGRATEVNATQIGDDDHYVTTINNLGDPVDQYGGLWLRGQNASGGAGNGYHPQVSPTSLVLWRVVSGSSTLIGNVSFASLSADTEYAVAGWVNGSTIGASIDGVSVEGTDTQYSTGQYVGFHVGDPAASPATTSPIYHRNFDAAGGLLVQEVHSSTTLPNGTSHDVDLTAPANGNLVVAVVHARHAYADQTGFTSGFTSRGVGQNTSTSDYTEVWTAIGDGSSYTNVQVTHGSSDAASLSVYEFAPPSGYTWTDPVVIEDSSTATETTGTTQSLTALTIANDSMVFAAYGMRTATAAYANWEGVQSSYHVLGTTGQTYDTCHGFALKSGNWTPTWTQDTSDTTIGAVTIAVQLDVDLNPTWMGNAATINLTAAPTRITPANLRLDTTQGGGDGKTSTDLYLTWDGVWGATSYELARRLPATATDDFNRANEALSASANWSIVAGANDANIVSNAVSYTSGQLGLRGGVYTGASFGDDQWAEVDVSPPSSETSQGGGVIVRSGYYATWTGDTGGRYRIGRIGGTILATLNGVGITGTRRIRLEAVGSHLAMYADNTLVLEVDDNETATGGSPGVLVSPIDFSDYGVVDNFTGGDVSVVPGLTATTYQHSSLTASTEYGYRVRARFD